MSVVGTLTIRVCPQVRPRPCRSNCRDGHARDEFSSRFFSAIISGRRILALCNCGTFGQSPVAPTTWLLWHCHRPENTHWTCLKPRWLEIAPMQARMSYHQRSQANGRCRQRECATKSSHKSRALLLNVELWSCRRCHARKVKCSGGQPCDGCRQSRKESECSYPRRQRMVKVDQR
jgi:hypothetical protein